MDQWLQLAHTNSAASLREAGCERFDILLDRNQAHHAFLYEIYETRDAWLSHCEQPHFKTFVGAVKDLLVERVRGEFDLLT